MANKKPRKTKKTSSAACMTRKQAARVPGVFVGDGIATSVGEKRKVCFNIGAKWFFRMASGP